jgi:hypothetical protein
MQDDHHRAPVAPVSGKLEVFIHCHGLLNADFGKRVGNVSDPYCKVFCEDGSLGHSETLADCLDPFFEKRFVVEYSENTSLRVEVWDKDFSLNLGGRQLVSDDFLGSATFNVAEIAAQIGTSGTTTTEVKMVPNQEMLDFQAALQKQQMTKQELRMKWENAKKWLRDKHGKWSLERVTKRIEKIRTSTCALRVEPIVEDEDYVIIYAMGEGLAPMDRAINRLKKVK